MGQSFPLTNIFQDGWNHQPDYFVGCVPIFLNSDYCFSNPHVWYFYLHSSLTFGSEVLFCCCTSPRSDSYFKFGRTAVKTGVATLWKHGEAPNFVEVKPQNPQNFMNCLMIGALQSGFEFNASWNSLRSSPVQKPIILSPGLRWTVPWKIWKKSIPQRAEWVTGTRQAQDLELDIHSGIEIIIYME